MIPDEEAEELVLRVPFYGICSSGGLCMATVKKMIEFAKDKGLLNIARVLESAYVDDCNSSVSTLEELEEIKQKMPRFMSDHGMPIKALAWTGEKAPEELTDNGFINTAGYSWEPESDTMKIMTPKIFHGEKKTGRFTRDTTFFEGEVTLETLQNSTKIRRLHMQQSCQKQPPCTIRLDLLRPLKFMDHTFVEGLSLNLQAIH